MIDIPAIPTSKSSYSGLLLWYSLILSLGGGIVLVNYFSGQSNISKGYIIPKEFSIRTEDLDGDGKKETVATYNGRKCLFMEDENGNPVTRGYRIVTEFEKGKTTSKLEILAECK